MLIDPVFGLIDRSTTIWEGKTWFAPIGKEVEVRVFGDEKGPNDEHRDLFVGLVHRYDVLSHAFMEQISQRYPWLWIVEQPDLLTSKLRGQAEDSRAMSTLPDIVIQGSGNPPAPEIAIEFPVYCWHDEIGLVSDMTVVVMINNWKLVDIGIDT